MPPGHDMVPPEGRRRTGSPPTRSGPEGSSRNGFSPGSLAGLPPFSHPGPERPRRPRDRMASDLLGFPASSDSDAAAEEGLPEPPPPEGPGLFGDPAPAAAPPPAPAPKPAAAAPTGPYRVLARKYRPTTFDD